MVRVLEKKQRKEISDTFNVIYDTECTTLTANTRLYS